MNDVSDMGRRQMLQVMDDWLSLVDLMKIRDDNSYFFFHAEDGIRVVAVTGVQTCALPIFLHLQDHGRTSIGVTLYEHLLQRLGARERVVTDLHTRTRPQSGVHRHTEDVPRVGAYEG